MVFETSYSGTYTPYNNYHKIPHPEFVLVHSIAHLEWAHCPAIRLVKLLRISFKWTLDSNDTVARTRNVRTGTIAQQCYVAVNTVQARAVGDGPAVIPAVNGL